MDIKLKDEAPIVHSYLSQWIVTFINLIIVRKILLKKYYNKAKLSKVMFSLNVWQGKIRLCWY